MSYEIKIPLFEGPFDLLLFFIERDELDIMDIPISEITNDFFEYISDLEKMNIEVASEFIVVAATLMRIKSRMLLPRLSVDEEGNEIDPREELVEHLIEYKKYKSVIDDFSKLEEYRQEKVSRGNLFSELNVIGERAKVETELQDIDLYKLLVVFKNAIDKYNVEQNKPKHEIYNYPYTIPEQKKFIINLLKSKSKVAMGHLECKGFRIHRGFVMDQGTDVKTFDKFDRVYSGHYHTRSNDGKIFYIGNPYQLFWNDCNDKRGFSFFDTETFELEFVQNPYTIFERIYYEDQNAKLFDTRNLKDKIVKVVVRKKSDPLMFDKFIDKVYKSGIHDLKIVENFEVNDDDVDFDGEKIEDTITILNKYVEDSDFGLNKERVKQLLREVYQQACEVE